MAKWGFLRLAGYEVAHAAYQAGRKFGQLDLKMELFVAEHGGTRKVFDYGIPTGTSGGEGILDFVTHYVRTESGGTTSFHWFSDHKSAERGATNLQETGKCKVIGPFGLPMGKDSRFR